MEESTNQHARHEGRSFSTAAFGDSTSEIELAALDEARKFFGPDVRMEIVKNYHVGTSVGHGEAANGKRYYSHVRIEIFGD
jgi:hypothetical protein